MSTQVAKLRQRLESLFPGQWIHTPSRTKTLFTGLNFLDQGPARGLARQRISAWIGPASCGKTSLLRSIIAHWLSCGFHIVYVDTANNLLASNWVFLEDQDLQDQHGEQQHKEQRGEDRQHGDQQHRDQQYEQGKFWMVRDLIDKDPLDRNLTDRNLVGKTSGSNNFLWAVETLIRSNIFDVVVLDLDTSQQTNWRSSKVYARWQNSLSKSKTALLLLTGNNHLPSGWNFYARLDFSWGTQVQYIEGLQGKTMILPSINCQITKDGIANNKEVPITAYVTNRLFTHSPVPDRRSAKT